MVKNAIIFPFFGNNSERYKLLAETIRWMSNQRGEKELFVVHNQLSNETGDLPREITNDVTYVRASGNPALWQKEALYNIGAKKALEFGAQNLIFADCDIVPGSEDWLIRMEEALLNNDWVHGGNIIYYLNQAASESIMQSKQKINIDPLYSSDSMYYELDIHSRVYLWKRSGGTTGKVGFPGGIWGVNQAGWDKYKGWDLHNFVGGGDLLHFNRLVRRLEESQHRSYGNLRALLYNPILQRYAESDPRWKIDCVNMPLYHFFHGMLEDRAYETRYKILLKPEFQKVVGSAPDVIFTPTQVINIENLIYPNRDSLLEINEKDQGFILFFEQMANYFLSRQDINLDVLNRFLKHHSSKYQFSQRGDSGFLQLAQNM